MSHGRAKALALFLGASVAFHGVLAWGLMHAEHAQAKSSPAEFIPPPVELESVWVESSSSASKPAPAHELAAPTAPTPRKQHKRVSVEPVRAVAQAEPLPVQSASIALPPEQAVPSASVAQTAGAPSGSESSASAEGTAPAVVGSRAAAGAGSAGPDGEDFKAYARLLSEAVARQRHYPPSAARLGMEGTAHVQLRVRLDGSLMEPPQLVRSSGQEVLDAEALRMVEAAAPFEPMPQAFSRPSTGFVIPVGFSLRSGH